MNEPKDPEAAETVETTNDQAVDLAAICSPVRDDIFGWFGDAAQTEPEHDPGFDAPCPICIHPVGRHSVDNPIKTISLMVEDPAQRRNSFFFRAHKRCWEMVSDHERSMVESSLIDHVVEADEHNQWDSLGSDEKQELIKAFILANTEGLASTAESEL
jgi:hypothetical protein